jgi:hypothetical protein
MIDPARFASPQRNSRAGTQLNDRYHETTNLIGVIEDEMNMRTSYKRGPGQSKYSHDHTLVY